MLIICNIRAFWPLVVSEAFEQSCSLQTRVLYELFQCLYLIFWTLSTYSLSYVQYMAKFGLTLKKTTSKATWVVRLYYDFDCLDRLCCTWWRKIKAICLKRESFHLGHLFGPVAAFASTVRLFLEMLQSVGLSLCDNTLSMFSGRSPSPPCCWCRSHTLWDTNTRSNHRAEWQKSRQIRLLDVYN